MKTFGIIYFIAAISIIIMGAIPIVVLEPTLEQVTNPEKMANIAFRKDVKIDRSQFVERTFFYIKGIASAHKMQKTQSRAIIGFGITSLIYMSFLVRKSKSSAPNKQLRAK